MSLAENKIQNISYWKERVDLAAAFRWAARFDLHEGVANHFSFSINDDGTKFLMNPNQTHFSRIKASDLIVVPSYQENLSNSIYEALSCGRPVVAFDIGGNNELIDHKINGYLAQPYDEEDLANGIKWVLNYANQKELEENARNKILKKFSHEHLLEDYLNLFASICKRSNNEDNQTI